VGRVVLVAAGATVFKFKLSIAEHHRLVVVCRFAAAVLLVLVVRLVSLVPVQLPIWVAHHRLT